MKYGVVTEDFVREYLSSQSILYKVSHYKGQMVLSDGTYSKCLDDHSVESTQTHQAIKELMHEHFEKERELLEDSVEKLKAIGGSRSLDDVYWLVNQEHYPIQWFDSFEAAMEHYRPCPPKRTVVTSESVPTQ